MSFSRLRTYRRCSASSHGTLERAARAGRSIATTSSVRIGDEYFDSSFFLHKEDTDLCWRLRLAGWEIWYVPTAVGAHARTTRGLGELSYLSALREFHRGAVEKSVLVQIHA